MTYTLGRDNLISFRFNVTASSSVKDAPARAKVNLIFTQTEANAIYQKLTDTSVQYTNQLHAKTDDTFKFNDYASGKGFDGTGNPTVASAKIYTDYIKLTTKFLNFVKNDLKRNNTIPIASADALTLNNLKFANAITDNQFTINLDYNIPRIAWNNDENKRSSLSTKIIKKIGLETNKTLKQDMPRIIKIMAFILARERGYSFGNAAYPSSEELLHREFGLICWSIINTCAKGGFGCKGNLLTLLKNENYSNYKNDNTGKPWVNLEGNDADETANMKKKYAANNNSNQNLEYFVLAFFAGWVNEEISGVTNWDHMSARGDGMVFSGQHLPKGAQNPDTTANIKISYKDGNVTKDITKNFPFHDGDTTLATSQNTTKTLDGNVLFTIN